MDTDRFTEESRSPVATAIPNPEFTGERIVPGKTAEALFREHEERYVFAAQYVSGKDVLDVACGTGVGTSFLRTAGGRSVRGVDIDPQSIAYAKAKYGDCEFAQGDAMQLALPNGCMDIVVSFETLEHLRDQRNFLLECRRVLRPGGILICSTPNLELSRWSASNPYHARELKPGEFQELVGGVFPSVELFGQRNRAYLSYVPRKTILRALELVGLRDAALRILGRKSASESFRTQFVNDFSSLPESILAYRRNFLSRPTYLIAVARNTSL
jgi:SAM-dependent methyltransferase